MAPNHSCSYTHTYTDRTHADGVTAPYLQLFARVGALCSTLGLGRQTPSATDLIYKFRVFCVCVDVFRSCCTISHARNTLCEILARNVFAKHLRTISFCHLLFGVGLRCAHQDLNAEAKVANTEPTRQQCVITTENSSSKAAGGVKRLQMLRQAWNERVEKVTLRFTVNGTDISLPKHDRGLSVTGKKQHISPTR